MYLMKGYGRLNLSIRLPFCGAIVDSPFTSEPKYYEPTLHYFSVAQKVSLGAIHCFSATPQKRGRLRLTSLARPVACLLTLRMTAVRLLENVSVFIIASVHWKR
jgi:hypothetical protein